MCGGMLYFYPDPVTGEVLERKTYFPIPHAMIPVMEEGSTVLYQWGKRQGEDPEIKVPQTGWARYDNLESDYWQKHKPEMRIIPAIEFSEKGKLPKSKWFDLPPDTYLMALKITKPAKSFLYVVTNPAEGLLQDIHPRMPLLVNRDLMPANIDMEDFYAERDEPTQGKLL